MNRASIARRFVLVLCQLAVVLLCSSSASAAGRIEWKSTAVKERDDKSWRLEVAVYMPKAPDVPHVPMKFEFQPTAYYARDMTDGDKPDAAELFGDVVLTRLEAVKNGEGVAVNIVVALRMILGTADRFDLASISPTVAPRFFMACCRQRARHENRGRPRQAARRIIRSRHKPGG